MKVNQSTKIKGVCYLSQEISQDIEGNRRITYSWPILMSVNVRDIFKVLYRKELKKEFEFHGLFYIPDHTFMFRCLQGSAKVFMADIRNPEMSVLNSNVALITAEWRNQIYLPAGVVWGLMASEADTIVQIHTTDEFAFHNTAIMDPLDKRIEFTWDNAEFSIADDYQDMNRIGLDEIADLDVIQAAGSYIARSGTMKCEACNIPGIRFLSKEEDHSQTQELFKKMYDYDEIAACGVKTSYSSHFEMHFPLKNTLRGFYIQDAPWTQTLMFRCVKGSCKIVLLDMREQRPTFRQHTSFFLDHEKDAFLYFEAGIAYAALSLEDETELYCFSSNPPSEAMNVVVNAFDGELRSEWPEHGIIASTKVWTAPKIHELQHNYW